ncbi:origin recognition complex subunit 2-like isoform X2 [Littorina saxatilis]|uniref:origin recognition complex subunit 2-like isoform X2 n=1 Tax=Littorina saxatilis TaxID=31220 RepID=UPI0038B58058
MQKERKKSVSVTFVNDEDVVQHILHIEDKKSGRGRKASKRSLSYSTGVDSSGRKKKLTDCDAVEGSSDEEDDNPSHLSALTLQDGGIGGKEVFSFRTPKKSGQMALKASESMGCLSPKTPQSSKGQKKGKGQSDRLPTTPQCRNKRASDQHKVPQTTTPYRLRKRNAADDSSDEDSVGDDSSDEESDNEAEDMEVDQGNRKGKTAAPMELTSNAEQYFDLHAAGVVTSDRTLSRLDLPQMDIQVLRETLEKSGNNHDRQCKTLCTKHHQLFKQWMLKMCNGFNILLYGLGSKRDLLEQFRKQHLSHFSHLVVNGYFPSLTIKQILTSITEDIVGHQGSFRSPLDQVEFIKQHFENQEYEDFYLVVHNIDGAMLRGEKTQNVLSMLSQIQGFHIMASVDHINAPLIWDQAKCSRFRWVWQDVTTYTQYLAETSYENSLLVQQSGGLALRSLAHVMRSLTPNARKIFELLAQYQLDNADNSSFVGMSFQDLYVKCRESFLVNSDQTLRAQLVEFMDHKLIRAKKNYDGVEHLMIPIESPALKEFLEQGEK